MPAAEAGSRFDRRARGAKVELAAREHLVAAGLRFVAANVNFRCGELDLVMQDRDRMGELLVFVEVRYREGGNNSGFGGGADSVDGWKRRKLMQAAQLYLLKQHSPEAPCRFDVVEASGDPCRPELHWIRDAFRADD